MFSFGVCGYLNEKGIQILGEFIRLFVCLFVKASWESMWCDNGDSRRFLFEYTLNTFTRVGIIINVSVYLVLFENFNCGKEKIEKAYG